MRISSDTLKRLLATTGKIDPDVLKQAEIMAAQTSEPLEQVLIRRHVIGERELVKLYASSLQLPFIDLTNIKIPKTTLYKIPERIAKQYQVVIFGQLNDTWQLAMADPEDIQAIDVIEKQLGTTVKIYVANLGDILTVQDQYRNGLDSEISQAIKDSSAEDTPAQAKVSPADISADAPIAKTVNIILEYAVKAKASDVHIEPRESIVQIRYRIDGLLMESMTLPKQILPAVISRIKIMANLKIDEHRVPQDGRFKATIGAKTIAVRVATLPIMDGEKVVMRILDESTKAATLDELGFTGQALKSIQDGIKQPHGMILVTGPTGAGKSTTLYSLLTLLNTPNVNISTVEDPVEYRVQGVNQTQVNAQAGMTFATGLRALLRQDPNIIMVGEVRDSETANLAVQAALTGHIVLSTLHTNNAATTLPRLLDMQIEPFLISTTVNTVIAQRLVRKLCAKCRQAYTPNGSFLTEIKSNFSIENGLLRFQATQHPELTQNNQPKSSVNVPAPAKTIADTAPLPDKPEEVDINGLTPGEAIAAHAQALQSGDESSNNSAEEATSGSALPRVNSSHTVTVTEGKINTSDHGTGSHRMGEMRKVIPVSAALDMERKSILDRIAEDPNIIDRPSKEADPRLSGAVAGEVFENKIAHIPQATPAPVVADTSHLADQAPPVSNANADAEHLVLYRAVGCSECDSTGYAGRMGLYEVLDISVDIGRLIMNKATANDIQSAAIKQGMVTMQEDGFVKALQGATTIEEVLRVTRE